tara:strand:+ start:1176 stop:1718 length:543 start_codon:yes stop_codon:yes gene_type:complete
MAKKITQAFRKKSLKATMEATKDGKVITLNPEAVIDVPIHAQFREYIIQTLNYVLASENDQAKVIRALSLIKTGFEDYNKDENQAVDPFVNSVYTLMSLISEINMQAAEQGKTIVTEEKIDENMSTLIKDIENNYTEEQTSDLFKTIMKQYKENIPGDIKFGNSEGDYDAEHKGKTSSED